MVRADLGVTSSTELDGATLCTNQGTTTELNAADYFRANNMQYEIVAFEKADEAVAAYNSGAATLTPLTTRRFTRSASNSLTRKRILFCRKSFPKNRSARPCGRVTMSGAILSLGCITPRLRRKNWA